MSKRLDPHERKLRKTVSIDPFLYATAEAAVGPNKKKFNFSAYVERLVEEDMEQRKRSGSRMHQGGGAWSHLNEEGGQYGSAQK